MNKYTIKYRKWLKEHGSDAANRYRRASRDRKQAWLNGLKDKPCKDCKRRYPPECMDFDHVKGKRGGIGTMAGLRREVILAEIKKCELVCANCHRIRTKRRQYGRGRRVQ